MKNMYLIAFGIIAAAVLLLVFSRRNKAAIAGGAYDEEPTIAVDEDCTGPCDVAKNEMGCVSCLLGPEESACYAECNIAQNDVACDGCLGALDYEPEWLTNDVWAEYSGENGEEYEGGEDDLEINPLEEEMTY